MKYKYIYLITENIIFLKPSSKEVIREVIRVYKDYKMSLKCYNLMIEALTSKNTYYKIIKRRAYYRADEIINFHAVMYFKNLLSSSLLFSTPYTDHLYEAERRKFDDYTYR